MKKCMSLLPSACFYNRKILLTEKIKMVEGWRLRIEEQGREGWVCLEGDHNDRQHCYHWKVMFSLRRRVRPKSNNSNASMKRLATWIKHGNTFTTSVKYNVTDKSHRAIPRASQRPELNVEKNHEIIEISCWNFWVVG